jgi:hypothetical protein
MTRSNESGFGLIEALVALSMLAMGMLGIASAFGQGMRSLSGSNVDIVAREKAVEAIESVFSSRDTKTITWAQIRNVSGETGSDGGVFLDAARPIYLPGADGLVNTADDSTVVETLVRLGTARQTLDKFTRQIEIRTIDSTLRQIRVIVRYQVGQEERVYELVTYISSYS